MRNDNIELIQRILEGDDAAFACLVKKYQKRVHALAWRKIGISISLKEGFALDNDIGFRLTDF